MTRFRNEVRLPCRHTLRILVSAEAKRIDFDEAIEPNAAELVVIGEHFEL